MSDVTSNRGQRFLTFLGAGVAGVVVLVAVLTALGLTVLRGAPGFREFEAFQDVDGTTQAQDPDRPLAERVPGVLLGDPAPVVLPVLSGQAPTASGVAAALRPLLDAKGLGKSLSVDVVDVENGEHLLSRAQNDARTPASTAKLLTGAAVLAELGPQTTLPTTVVDGATDGEIVLVGGGDVLLGRGKDDAGAVSGRAGVTTLAARAAAALRTAGRDEVAVRLDDTLFSGPDISPGWGVGDVGSGYVAPVHALEMDAGRLRPEDYSARSADPGMATARAFADELRERGIDVRGKVTRAAAAGGAAPLARVDSATVGEQVEYALTMSDNTVAEALARLVAVRAGQPGSFAAAGPAVLQQVGALGVPVTGAVLSDGSGLDKSSRVPPATLTGVLALAAGDAHPQLRPLLSGLPVAAVSGTLSDRFAERDQRGARGVVRAKTGTLNGVSSLAGTAVDADGRLLVFAVMADKVKSTGLARIALDDVVAELAACGCR